MFSQWSSCARFVRVAITFLTLAHVVLANNGGGHGHGNDACRKPRSALLEGRNQLAPRPSGFWLEKIKHQGRAPFHPNATEYKVFRNVKDYGAVGDGITDDTDAINLAIRSQNRCELGECESSTTTPAVVYFPAGTYLVSKPIVAIYYTQLVGDATNLPTILASPDFTGLAVIDANPYLPGGGQYYINQVNFFRSIRNFIIDTRQVPPEKADGTGIHWQVSQATSLANIVFQMSDAPNTAHQGIWMENGSGGYMGDMIFNGGKYGIWGGNQQFTVRNVTMNNVQTGFFTVWNWQWTYQNVRLNNCRIGFEINSGSVAASSIIDAVSSNTPVFIQYSQPSNGTLLNSGSLVLNNIKFSNSPVGVQVAASEANNGTATVVLEGGDRTVEAWVQGNVYGTEKRRGGHGHGHGNENDFKGEFIQDYIRAPEKGRSLLDRQGNLVSRGRPQYEGLDVSDFISVRDEGAKGDGVTDDTAVLQRVLDKYSACKVIYLDAGFYIVTKTLNIPAGTRLVGEGWSVLAGKGPLFQDQNKPKPVFRVGEKGQEGTLEITDVIFTTVGPAAGAIVVEWNIREPRGVQAGTGMWDTHIRLGATAGTELENDKCPKDGSGGFTNCFAAFLALHITERASGYFEGTWVWLGDHDLDRATREQINVYSGRGVLSESQGPVWMIGTGSEHHVIYQYNLVGAKDHYMGLIQTESPYYQPTPNSPYPFKVDHRYHDPEPYKPNPTSAWALNVEKSRNILIMGAGLYSFFDSYTQECIANSTCQAQIANFDKGSNVDVFSISTVATTWQVSRDGQGVVNQKDNENGFADTVSLWRNRK